MLLLNVLFMSTGEKIVMCGGKEKEEEGEKKWRTTKKKVEF